MGVFQGEHPSREEANKVGKVFTHFKESVNKSILSTEPPLLLLCFRRCRSLARSSDGVSLDQRSVEILLPLFAKTHPCAPRSPWLRL